ncbi:MAG: hypothetical protein KDA75_10725, partial [Planctomycetaceae bacterium]|nr:hypothetical protein [Planctomycetaceae bacterium]
MVPPAHLLGSTLCGALLLGQPRWVWVAAAIGVAAGLMLTVVYRRSGWPTGLSWLAGGLKVLGIVLIAACFLEPLWSGTRARPGENLVLVAADSSASLQIEDADVKQEGQREARWKPFQRELSDSQLPWQVRLSQDFRVRRYSLAAAANPVQSFENIEWTGNRSSLGQSLRSLRERYHDHPVAATLLFTDGLATDGLDPSDPVWANGPPIYPVLPKTVGEIRDVAIEQIAVTQSSFEDAPVMIQADVVAAIAANEPLVVRLIDADGSVVEEQTLPSNSDGRPVPFRFQTRPTSPLSFYRIQARAESDPA